ncbi:DUF6140 family protein [Formosa sp. PL04]|uniref:DUF6140 family protein n=1 Tax=Formosa sp. PL04 TaxID=3081755 RepID=UPI002980EF0B|nr:DUF6140 family protein [Formosa sp. PL04]MDW5288579.1 DUF6140 family protein [Formosa sp. PL04]
MPTFKITTKQALSVQGEYVGAGLFVQVTCMMLNPFDEVEKVHKAFLRMHGIDFKPEGYLNPGYFNIEEL